MKKIFLLAAAFVFTLTVSAQSKPEEIAKFNTETYDFGKIKQGVPAIYYFEVKNISNKPIVVESVSAGCGCTVPEKPEEPIEPGKVGKIKVQYSAASVAPFTKDVYVKLSGAEQKTLHITGEVLTAEAYEAYMKEKANTPAKNDKEKPKN
jgi:hypothetical protein